MDKKEIKPPIYFKIYNSDKIYKADSHRKIHISEFGGFDVVHINDEYPDEPIKVHRYGSRRPSDKGWAIYLVKDGDKIFKTLYDSKLARKLYPKGIPHEGYLLI